MKAIFLVKSKEKINNVYRPEAVDKFLHDLLPMDIYSKDDVINDRSAFRNVEYIFSTWYMPTFTEEEIQHYFPSLNAIFYAAGSVKYFAVPFFNCGVHVFSAGRANSIPVAEFVVSQILLANKGYFQAQRAYRKPLFKFSYKEAHQYVDFKTGNYDAKVGLIGAGMVGSKVIELLKPYQLEILVADPYISEQRIQELGAKKVELSELFKVCDVISNHLPNIPDTKGILNYSLFSIMKSSATFINTGRGTQVIENDLIKVLHENPQTTALLDVTEKEPLRPWSPFYFMKNVFITPHIAGSIGQEEQRMAEYIYSAYADHKSGKENSCEVTFELLTKRA